MAARKLVERFWACTLPLDRSLFAHPLHFGPFTRICLAHASCSFLCCTHQPLMRITLTQGMANEFYRQRVAEHLRIGLEAVRALREQVSGWPFR